MKTGTFHRCLLALGAGLAVAAGLWVNHPASAQPRGQGPGGGTGQVPTWKPLPVSEEEAMAPVDDTRIFVPMPPAARKYLREQMKGFLGILMQVQGLMAEGKLDEAGKLIETNMGRSERGRFAGKTGTAPGRYMPVPMRTMAWGMHDSASQFAETAGKGDVKESYLALQQLQASCVACHATYRTR